MAHGLALQMEEILRASYQNGEPKVSRYKEVDMNSGITRSADAEVLLIIKSWRDMINNPKKNRTDFFSLIRRTLLITLSKNWMSTRSSLKTQLLESLAVCKVSFSEKVDRCDDICRSVINVALCPWRNVYFDWEELFSGRLTYEDKKVQNYMESEIEEVIIARAHSLLLTGYYDTAMDLVKCLFKYYSRIASGPFCKINKTKGESNAPICKNPKDRRGFSTMEWYIFLLKRKGAREIINDLKEFSCHEGIEIVNRLRKNEQTRASAYSALQVFIIKDLIRPSDYCCTKRLFIIWCEMLKDIEQEKVTQIVQKVLAGYAPSSAHFYLFGDALWDQFGTRFLSLHTELYIRGLTSDINHLEVMRNSDLPGDMESLENHIASMFDKLSTLYSNSHEEVARECMFSAFSLRPTEQRLYVLQSLTHSLLSRDNDACKESSASSNSLISNSSSKKECSCGFQCSGTCKSISKSSAVFHPLLTRGIKNVKYYLVKDLVCVLECVRCVNFQYNVFDWSKNATELGDYLSVHVQSQQISRRPYNWGSDSETEFASDYSCYGNNEMAIDKQKPDNSNFQVTDMSSISLKRKNKSDFNNEMFSLDVGANIEVESDDSANKKLKTEKEFTHNMDQSENQRSLITYNKLFSTPEKTRALSLFEATTKLSSNEMVDPCSLTNFAKAEHCKTDLNSFNTVKSRTPSPINLKSSFIQETNQPQAFTSDNYSNTLQNQYNVVAHSLMKSSQNNSNNFGIVFNKNIQADLLAESSRVKPITLPFSNAVINKCNPDTLLNNYKHPTFYSQEALNLSSEHINLQNAYKSQKAKVKKIEGTSVDRSKAVSLITNVSNDTLTKTKAIPHQLNTFTPNSASSSVAPKQSQKFVIPKIKHSAVDSSPNAGLEVRTPSSESYSSVPNQSRQFHIFKPVCPSLDSLTSTALGTGTPSSASYSSVSKQSQQFNLKKLGRPKLDSSPSTGLRTGTSSSATYSSAPAKSQQFNIQKSGHPSLDYMANTGLGTGIPTSASYSSAPKQVQQFNIQKSRQSALTSTPSTSLGAGTYSQKDASHAKSVPFNSLIEMLQSNKKTPTSKPDGSILQQLPVSDRGSVIIQHTTQMQNITAEKSVMPKNSHLQGIPISLDKNTVHLSGSFPSTPGRYKVISMPLSSNYTRKQSNPQNLTMSHSPQLSQSNSRLSSELQIANSQSSNDSSTIPGKPASSKCISQPVSLINKKPTWSSTVKPHGHVEYTKSSVEKSQLDVARIYQMAKISVTQGNSSDLSAIPNYQLVHSAKNCTSDKRTPISNFKKSNNVVMMTQGNTNQHTTISASKITNPNFVADSRKGFTIHQRNNQTNVTTMIQQGNTLVRQTISTSVANPRQNIFAQNIDRSDSNSRSNEMRSHVNVINQQAVSISKVMSNPRAISDNQKNFALSYERNNSNATITTHGNIPNEVVYSTGISDARNNISNQKTFCVPNVEKSSNNSRSMDMDMSKSNPQWYSTPFPKPTEHTVAQDLCDYTNRVSILEARNSPSSKSNYTSPEHSLQTAPTFNNNVNYLSNSSSSNKGLYRNSTPSPVLKNRLLARTPELQSDTRSSLHSNLQTKPSPSFSNSQLLVQQFAHQTTSLPIQNVYSAIKPGNLTATELSDVYKQLNTSISVHTKLLDPRKQSNQNSVLLSQMPTRVPASPSCRIKACCSPLETNPCDNCSASETNRSASQAKNLIPDHKALSGSYQHPNSMVYSAIEQLGMDDRNSKDSHSQENHDYELFHTPKKGDAEWHCQFCEKTLSSPSSLQLHLTTFHSLETIDKSSGQKKWKLKSPMTVNNLQGVNRSTTDFKSSLAAFSTKKPTINTKSKSGLDSASKNLSKGLEGSHMEDNLNNIEDNVFKMCMDLIDNDHDLNQIVKDVEGLSDDMENCPLPLETYASNPACNSSFIDIVQKVELPSDFLHSLSGDNDVNFLNGTVQHHKTTNDSLKGNEPKPSEVNTVFTGILDFINTEQKFQNFIQEFDADDRPVSFDESVSTDDASDSEIDTSNHSSTTVNILGSPSILLEEKLPDSKKLNEESNIEEKKSANSLSSQSKKVFFHKDCKLCNERFTSALEYKAHIKNIHLLLASDKKNKSDIFDFSEDSDHAEKSALALQIIKKTKKKCDVKSATNLLDSLIPNNKSQNSNIPGLNIKSLSNTESKNVQPNFNLTKSTTSSDGKIKKKCEHCGRMLSSLYMKKHIKKMHSESLESKCDEKNYMTVKVKSEFSTPSIVAESKNCHTTFSVLHEQDIDSSTCLSMSDALKTNKSFELTNTNQAESVAGTDNAQTKSNLGFCFEVPESRNKGNFFSIRKEKCIDPKILDLSPTSSKHLINSTRVTNSKSKQGKAKCNDAKILDLSPTSSKYLINSKRLTNSTGKQSNAECSDPRILDLSPTSSKHLKNTKRSTNSKGYQNKAMCIDPRILDLSPTSSKHLINMKPSTNSNDLIQKRKSSSLTPKELTCKICSKTFCSTGNLTRHKKQKHKIFIPLKKSQTNEHKNLLNNRHNISSLEDNKSPVEKNADIIRYSIPEICNSIVIDNCSVKQEMDVGVTNSDNSAQKEINLTNNTGFVKQEVGVANSDHFVKKNIDVSHCVQQELSIVTNGNCSLGNNLRRQADKNSIENHNSSSKTFSLSTQQETNTPLIVEKNRSFEDKILQMPYAEAVSPDSENLLQNNYLNIKLQINKDFQNNLCDGNSSNSGELSGKPIDCTVQPRNTDAEHLTCSNNFEEAVRSQRDPDKIEIFVEKVKIKNSECQVMQSSLIATENLRFEDIGCENNSTNTFGKQQSVASHSNYQVACDGLSPIDIDHLTGKKHSTDFDKEFHSAQFHSEMEQNLNRETVIKSSKCLNLSPSYGDLRTMLFEKNDVKIDIESDENYIDDVFIKSNKLNKKDIALENCGSDKVFDYDDYVLEKLKYGSPNEFIIQKRYEDSQGFANINPQKELTEVCFEEGNDHDCIERDSQDDNKKLVCAKNIDATNRQYLKEFNAQYKTEVKVQQEYMETEIKPSEKHACEIKKEIKQIEKSGTDEINLGTFANTNITKVGAILENYVQEKFTEDSMQETNENIILNKFTLDSIQEMGVNIVSEKYTLNNIQEATENSEQESPKKKQEMDENKLLEKYTPNRMQETDVDIILEKCILNCMQLNDEKIFSEKVTLNSMQATDENIVSEKFSINSTIEMEKNIISEKSALNNIQEMRENIFSEKCPINCMQETNENIVSDEFSKSVIEAKYEKCDMNKKDEKFVKNIILKREETKEEDARQEREELEKKNGIQKEEDPQNEIYIPQMQGTRKDIHIQENMMTKENMQEENVTAKDLREENETGRENDIELYESIRVDKKDDQEKEKNNMGTCIAEDKNNERNLQEEHYIGSDAQQENDVESDIQFKKRKSYLQNELNDRIINIQDANSKLSYMQEKNGDSNDKINMQVEYKEIGIKERYVQGKEKSNIENNEEGDVDKNRNVNMQEKETCEESNVNNGKSILDKSCTKEKSKKIYIVENNESKVNIILDVEVKSNIQEIVNQKDFNNLIEGSYKQENIAENVIQKKYLKKSLCKRNVEKKDVGKECNLRKNYLENNEKPLLSKLQEKHLQEVHPDFGVQEKHLKGGNVPKNSKSYIREKYEENDTADEEVDFDKIIEEINAQRKANHQVKCKKVSLYEKSNFCAQKKLNKSRFQKKCINVADTNETKPKININIHEANLETVTESQKEQNITQVILEETIKAFDGIDDLNITTHFHNKQRSIASCLGPIAITNSTESEAISHCGLSSEISTQTSSHGIELFSAQELFSPQESNQQLEVLNYKHLKVSTSSSGNVFSFSKLGECPECHEVFNSISDLNRHIKTVHLLNGIHVKENNTTLNQRLDNFIDKISKNSKISNFDDCKQDTVEELRKENIFESKLKCTTAQTDMNIAIQTDQKDTKNIGFPQKTCLGMITTDCVQSPMSIKNKEKSCVQEKNQRKNVHLRKCICESNLHLKGAKPTHCPQKNCPLPKKHSISLNAPSNIKPNTKSFRCKVCRTMLFGADSFKNHMSTNHNVHNNTKNTFNAVSIANKNSRLKLLCKNEKSNISSSVLTLVQKLSDTDSTSSSPNNSLQTVLPIPRIKKLSSSDKDSSQDTQDFPVTSVLNGKKMPRSGRFRLDFVETRSKHVKLFSNRIKKKKIRNIRFSDEPISSTRAQHEDGKVSNMSFPPLDPITRKQSEESCQASQTFIEQKAESRCLKRCGSISSKDVEASKSTNVLQQDPSLLPHSKKFDGELKRLMPPKNSNFNKRLRGKFKSMPLSFFKGNFSVVETFKTSEEISMFLKNKKQPVPQLTRCDGRLNNDQKIQLDQMRLSSTKEVVDCLPCHVINDITSPPKEPLIVRVRKSDTNPSQEANSELINNGINEIFLPSTQSNKNAFPELIIKGKLYTIKKCSISLEKLSCGTPVP